MVLVLASFSHADNWPFFRGGNRDGISKESSAPTSWGVDKNIKWRAPLPSAGNSSPIVFGDQIYVTCAENSRGTELDANDGPTIWETPEPGGADDKSAETKTGIGSWSSPVPAMVDGKQQIL